MIKCLANTLAFLGVIVTLLLLWAAVVGEKPKDKRPML